MSYAAAIDALSALAPELFTKPGRPRRKFSLAEIGVLLDELGNPQRHFQSILIAGTNGKGSTAATLASILGASGLRTGLYTSPHLERPNERIRIQDAEINDDDFARQYFAVHDAAERLVGGGRLEQTPSFFEILTAMAFLEFAEYGVDLAVLEVGLGGRLDATNIVDPLVSVITDISLDHMEWLGTTISAIAHEKAGILRRRGMMITLPQHPEANQVLGEVAADLDVRAVSAAPYLPAVGEAEKDRYEVEALGASIRVASPLSGRHQQRNVALAIAAAVELVEHHGFPVTPEAIEVGIQRTRWPGRLERIRSWNSDWVLDVAHNPAGAWALRAGLRHALDTAQRNGGGRVLIFSCLRDKPVEEIAQILFPLFDEVIFSPIHSPRAAAMEALLSAAATTGTPARIAESTGAALDLAREKTSGGLAVVSGSVYLVGEIRGLLLGRQSGEPG